MIDDPCVVCQDLLPIPPIPLNMPVPAHQGPREMDGLPGACLPVCRQRLVRSMTLIPLEIF